MEHHEYKGYQITKAYIASTPYFWITKIFQPLDVSGIDIYKECKEDKRPMQRTSYRLRVGDFDTLEEAKKAIDKGFND
mgnify:FL=1